MGSMGVGPPATRPADLLGGVCFLHGPKDRESSLPGCFLPFPSPRTDLFFVNFSSDDDHAGGYLCHHRGSDCK